MPLASALPPSMGTTGPMVLAGAGLVRGIGWAGALTAAGLPPPTVASTTPMAVPASTSTLNSTGTRRLGFTEDGMARRQRRRTASANECIGPNISPEATVPGGCKPGQGAPGPARHRRQAGCAQVKRGASGRHQRDQAGLARTSLSSPGVVTGAWQVNWRQT